MSGMENFVKTLDIFENQITIEIESIPVNGYTNKENIKNFKGLKLLLQIF